MIFMTNRLTNAFFISILAITALSFNACDEDLLLDDVGCVTCVDAQNITIEACSDGFGNLTTTQNNDPSSALESQDTTLEEFRDAQEQQGSTCQ